MPIEKQPERLGSFYLGAEYDVSASETTDVPVHYDARDLTTHAVCVGMTGSGKTGLCVGLLEEAALDRVPAIIIDPKGDMGNLLLHFDELRPEDFEPWVNDDDARRKGMTKAEYAAKMATLWESGLASSGIGKERISALSDAVDYSVFTPGSTAATPINVLGSFDPPENATDEELHETSQGVVAALLGLIGVEADPVTSREATFLAVLIEHFWSEGIVPDVAALVRAIPDPPVRQFGVFDVDSFFPEKDRFELAMRFNNLLASPNFGAWLEGTPLDISEIMYTPEGKPRHSIFYIAHLSDEERMFFVTLLLENLISWMRLQPGTTSLRALLYFDEIFGFLPPVAEPPSKRSLLTILKQGRAFGLGTVLVTQNPVDLDYKALSNAGTWFIGRLQSEQDQSRLLDGLKGSDAASSGTTQIQSAIGKLKSRVFLLHNVHDDGPVLFHTRWAMNYLRGPLTRRQLGDLPNVTSATAVSGGADPESRTETRTSPPTSIRGSRSRPAMPKDVDERFLAGRPGPLTAKVGAEVTVTFFDRKYEFETQRSELLLLDGESETLDWRLAEVIEEPYELESSVEGAEFAGALPVAANTAAELRSAESDLDDHIYRTRSIELMHIPSLEVCQRPGESLAAFRGRAELAARELRDKELDKIRDRYDGKIGRLEERLRRKERDVADREADVSGRQQEEWIRLGETVLGMVLGGRRRGLGGSASKRRMTQTARQRLSRALADADDVRADIADLQSELQDEVDEVTQKWAQVAQESEVHTVKPRRADVQIDFIGIVWA